MSADLEYNEYFLTDNGWIAGDSKYIGEPVHKAELPENIGQLSYMRIRIYSEAKTVGQVGTTYKEKHEKKGCGKKIDELLKKYPKPTVQIIAVLICRSQNYTAAKSSKQMSQ